MYPTTQFEASLLGRKLCREMNGDFVDGYWSEIVPNVIPLPHVFIRDQALRLHSGLTGTGALGY
jgi:hypothetical protein